MPLSVTLVAGPTASGKSRLALELASRQPSRIINTDAMQIYEGLAILTAQPTGAQASRAPHALYGFVAPRIRFSVAKWLEAAEAEIDDCMASRQQPILVGGTGLYFRALIGGLAAIPSIDANVRDEAGALFDEIGEAAFRERLGESDPESAGRIERGDRQRLVRAYEVVAATGKPIGTWHREASRPARSYSFEPHLVMPDRQEIYLACDARFRAMVDAGAVGEVETLLKLNLDPSLPAMKVLGVPEIASYLEGQIGLEEAIGLAQLKTRHYAKRQMTWFRHQWPFGTSVGSR